MKPFRSSLLVAVLALLPALYLVQGCRRTQPVAGGEPGAPRLAPTVLLVSLDGFRWDYLDRYEAPTLAQLAAEGVRAERLVPSFPTKTFPNHYTLVTGLYAARHGIVANTMYDPVFDASFSLGDRAAVADGRWWGGEPLWVTVEKQGRRSGTYFWPGSEAEIQGVRPSYWVPFDDAVPAAERVAQVLAWLDLPPAERPVFLTLYFSDVDTQGHRFGPDSEEVAQAVRVVDGYLALLVEGLKARGLYDAVNLIVVSDHGMAATSSQRVLLLDDYIDLADVRIVELHPVAMLIPEAGRTEAVYDALRRTPHLAVYRKEDVPEALHYRDHRRITPLVGIAEEGWSIATRERYERNPARYDGGAHGYDHRLPSMGALFVARGPAFVEGLRVGPFANLHVYNLMAAVLGVTPAPNDGDPDAVLPLLKPAVRPP